ncbi:beta,beta-carotene 9',10'-oxygenase-like [Dendronephthya gigantea]|uniref:beta,beta-carotene 9',10'-oxygenase-like n=1 Tax=Dendronephthya gigantea TaxID=151771 RepID=UPI00106A70C9|nr:beta,beta-carotene 9',10'-oxygenase-like [Dendronephthya gigantea]
MDELFQTPPETRERVSAEVKGTIPDWVNGTLLRNAPAKYEFGKHAYKHWFDGLSLLHAFIIEKGEVSYHSKYLETNAYTKGSEKERIAYAEFGTAELPDPCQNIFSRFFSYFWPPERTDNTAVNVFTMKGKVFANSDSPFMNEIDPDTLEILDVTNAKTDIDSARIVYACAHPHEENDGNVYHVMTSVGRQSRYNIVQVPPAQRATHIKVDKPLEGAKIIASLKPHKSITYYHSFGITTNYFIFVENPFSINSFEVLRMKVEHRSFHECMHWDAKEPSRFYLIERRSGACVGSYEAHSFFSFHHVNAYEDINGLVVVDLCCYPDATIIDQYYLHYLRNSKIDKVGENFADPEVRRYRLPIPGKSASRSSSPRLTYEILGSDLELPRINYRFNGQEYRYIYGTGPYEHGHFLDQLVKLDTVSKLKKTWYQSGCFPSEPVFIERPGAKDEDDGVIVSGVVGTGGEKSFLLVLDAASFEELARAVIPSRLPQSLHGNFFPDLSYKLKAFYANKSKPKEMEVVQ